LAKVAAAIAVATASGLTLTVAAYGSTAKESASDLIGKTYVVAVTSINTRTSMPAVFSVVGAELTTVCPDGSGTLAPQGKIYLWLDASSGPQQGTPAINKGEFFSGMTPLPASSMNFTAKSGHRYPATRANAVNQTYNPNANVDDGLLDATFYFTVPISTRTGVILISKSSMMGTPYTGFVGGSALLLTTAGPTSIPLAFPKDLTVTTTPTTIPVAIAAGSTGANFLNVVGALFTVCIVGYIALKVRRRYRRHAALPTSPRVVAHPSTSPPDTSTSVATPPKPPTVAIAKDDLLRVAVMGPLTIEPSRHAATDPLRAFIAYLALHDDRPQNADEIQTALWPDDGIHNGVTQKTFLNYVSRARQFIGVQHLPEVQSGSGYSLASTATDWREFRTLAQAAERTHGSKAIAMRREALTLVRGVPFEGDTTSYFEWSVAQKYVTSMIEGVTRVADQLQRDLVSTGDLDSAEWAVRQAMKLAPTELPLWRALVDVCDARNDDNVMTRFWVEAEHELWPKAVDELRARLVG
jgi:DNA-binding SARP family transcriptional activator